MPVTSSAARWGTVADAAREFRVGESTVRRWIRDGRVRSEKVGGHRRRVALDSVTDGRGFGRQIAAAFATLDQRDMEAIARVTGKILPATDDNASAFYAVWQTIGAAARSQAKAASQRA